ncbi:hypothetical protein ACFVS9_09425 [Streptomyces sp. NPDC058008]|uniref:SCO2400 family protein n=1 Tax=Streptomyces sp. NPDC058008 TaxID=3346303 RepID=UPI0036E0827E
MDYCHPCQRHLNGALACAGCGTPAEALVPYAVADPSGRRAEPAVETLEPEGAAGRRRGARAAAGRRRRGHRRRGRALLLTAVGVVLALGALSLAELAMEPGGDSGASEYVSEATPTATEPGPPASSGAEPDDPGPVDTPTVVPVTDSRSATAAEADAPSAAEESGASPSAPVRAETSASASVSASSDPDVTRTPEEPSEPGTPSEEPTRPEPTEDPAPSPSPTETCRWWIFC